MSEETSQEITQSWPMTDYLRNYFTPHSLAIDYGRDNFGTGGLYRVRGYKEVGESLPYLTLSRKKCPDKKDVKRKDVIHGLHQRPRRV